MTGHRSQHMYFKSLISTELATNYVQLIVPPVLTHIYNISTVFQPLNEVIILAYFQETHSMHVL